MAPTLTPSPGLTPPPSEPGTTSAADDAALKAIEALEAETPDAILEVEPVPSTPVAASPIAAPVPEPTIPTTPAPAPAAMPSTIQSSVAAELSNAEPVASAFQPFAKKKRSRAPLVVLIVILLLGLLGAGGYFGWQYLQNNRQPGTPTTSTDETGDEDTATQQDSTESINATATDIETQLDALDDSEFSDDALSDAALYQ